MSYRISCEIIQSLHNIQQTSYPTYPSLHFATQYLYSYSRKPTPKTLLICNTPSYFGLCLVYHMFIAHVYEPINFFIDTQILLCRNDIIDIYFLLGTYITLCTNLFESIKVGDKDCLYNLLFTHIALFFVLCDQMETFYPDSESIRCIKLRQEMKGLCSTISNDVSNNESKNSPIDMPGSYSLQVYSNLQNKYVKLVSGLYPFGEILKDNFYVIKDIKPFYSQFSDHYNELSPRVQ